MFSSTSGRTRWTAEQRAVSQRTAPTTSLVPFTQCFPQKNAPFDHPERHEAIKSHDRCIIAVTSALLAISKRSTPRCTASYVPTGRRTPSARTRLSRSQRNRYSIREQCCKATHPPIRETGHTEVNFIYACRNMLAHQPR